MKVKATKKMFLHEAWMNAKGDDGTWELSRSLPDGGLLAKAPNGDRFFVPGKELAIELIERSKRIQEGKK